jgi:hypothetical protein
MRRITAALLFAVTACTSAPRPQPAPPSTPVAPAQSQNRLTPLTSVDRAIVEPRIRVGLLSDQSTVAFPRITDGYYVITDAGPSVIRRGFTATAPQSGAAVRFAVQASAISDQTSAEAFAQKIRTETDQRVDLVFDPAIGAYKVLVGDFPDNDAAIPGRNALISRGYGRDMLIVRRPSDQPFEKVHQIVDDEGDRYTIRGESILILPVTAQTIAIGEKQYRTAARLFVNTRGLYNVINELNLEDYLYGVVPAEMGPRIFDEVEALKAQATAARTYAVRNLGQFRAEGYDICPGPACQAYNGFSAEDPLSNRAVQETAGQVMMYQGALIDALYTSRSISEAGALRGIRSRHARGPRRQWTSDRTAGERPALRRARGHCGGAELDGARRRECGRRRTRVDRRDGQCGTASRVESSRRRAPLSRGSLPARRQGTRRHSAGGS